MRLPVILSCLFWGVVDVANAISVNIMQGRASIAPPRIVETAYMITFVRAFRLLPLNPLIVLMSLPFLTLLLTLGGMGYSLFQQTILSRMFAASRKPMTGSLFRLH